MRKENQKFEGQLLTAGMFQANQQQELLKKLNSKQVIAHTEMKELTKAIKENLTDEEIFILINGNPIDYYIYKLLKEGKTNEEIKEILKEKRKELSEFIPKLEKDFNETLINITKKLNEILEEKEQIKEKILYPLIWNNEKEKLIKPYSIVGIKFDVVKNNRYYKSLTFLERLFNDLKIQNYLNIKIDKYYYFDNVEKPITKLYIGLVDEFGEYIQTIPYKWWSKQKYTKENFVNRGIEYVDIYNFVLSIILKFFALKYLNTKEFFGVEKFNVPEYMLANTYSYENLQRLVDDFENNKEIGKKINEYWDKGEIDKLFEIHFNKETITKYLLQYFPTYEEIINLKKEIFEKETKVEKDIDDYEQIMSKLQKNQNDKELLKEIENKYRKHFERLGNIMKEILNKKFELTTKLSRVDLEAYIFTTTFYNLIQINNAFISILLENKNKFDEFVKNINDNKESNENDIKQYLEILTKFYEKNANTYEKEYIILDKGIYNLYRKIFGASITAKLVELREQYINQLFALVEEVREMTLKLVRVNLLITKLLTITNQMYSQIQYTQNPQANEMYINQVQNIYTQILDVVKNYYSENELLSPKEFIEKLDLNEKIDYIYNLVLPLIVISTSLFIFSREHILYERKVKLNIERQLKGYKENENVKYTKDGKEDNYLIADIMLDDTEIETHILIKKVKEYEKMIKDIKESKDITIYLDDVIKLGIWEQLPNQIKEMVAQNPMMLNTILPQLGINTNEEKIKLGFTIVINNS